MLGFDKEVEITKKFQTKFVLEPLISLKLKTTKNSHRP